MPWVLRHLVDAEIYMLPRLLQNVLTVIIGNPNYTGAVHVFVFQQAAFEFSGCHLEPFDLWVTCHYYNLSPVSGTGPHLHDFL
jgi:hypothetical protein